MTKRFVLSTDPMTADAEAKLRNALKVMAFWHWLPNFWLLKDQHDRFTVESIRDAVQEVDPTARCIVLEVEPETWASLGRPNAAGKAMESWMISTWDKED